MAVRAYVEWLDNIGPDRMAELSAEGTVSDWYVLLGPVLDNEGQPRPAVPANHAAWDYTARKVAAAGGNLWGWYVCTPNQAVDVSRIGALDARFGPAGWLLNIEKLLERVALSVLSSGVKALGKPIVASLAGANPNHNLYDHRTLDRAGVVCEWQAYLDSGEGPPPDVAVRELWQPTTVHVGMEYRSRIGMTYGWGRITRAGLSLGFYDAYKLRGPSEYEFEIAPKEWGWTVQDRNFAFVNGRLLGLAAYSKIRVALDVTRGALEKRDLAGWEALAARARPPGLAKPGVSVYLGEVCPDDVLRAIAKGAG